MQLERSSSTLVESIASRIAEIAASLLRVSAVTSSSDFFALGGNSLLSAQLVFQLQQEYRVDLSVKDIFEAKTVQRITDLVCARLAGDESAQQAHPDAAQTEARTLGSSGLESTPATAQQRSIWLLEHSPSGEAVSNVAIVLSYRGTIDHTRLEGCVRELVSRHPALRTVYVQQGASVIQRLEKYVIINQRFLDLGDAPADEKTTVLERTKADEIARPFDLERDAMVRLTHIRLTNDEGVLLFVFHHIAVDDRSLEVFFDQLQQLYATDDPARVTTTGRSFLDYCQEEAEAEADGDRDESVDFWRVQLQDMKATGYPSRRQLPETRTFEGRHGYHALPVRLSEALDAAAARRSTTPFTVFTAAVVYLLHRATGRDDICVASLMSRRDRFTDADVMGCFVNTVPLRMTIDPDGTLDELIKTVISSFVETYAHRHVSFEDMMENARPEAGNRGGALPVTINLEAEKVETFTLGNARLQREPLDRGIAKRDLVFSLRKVGDSYRILAEYRSDLYSAEDVTLLCENLEAAIEQLVENSSARVDAQLLAPPPMRPAVFAGLGWSQERQGKNAEPTAIHELFRQARQGHEDKSAIVGASGILTYKALDDSSDAVASALIQEGIEPGQLVGVIESRRTDTIVALLGVWKAGAAYLMLDPGQPASALERTVGACRPALVLGQRKVLTSLPALGLPTLTLEAARAASVAPALAQRRTEADALAYVCMTSGSSGTPKAVAVRHASIGRIVRGTSYAQLSSDDVFLNLSPLSFDGSVFEVWAPLANGATLRLMHDGPFSLDDVAAALTEGRVSVFFVTTRLFNALVDHKLESLLGTPTILFGGEKASREHVERLISAGYTGNLRNIYGPTEATVFATSHAITQDSLQRHRAALPIGTAHNETSVVVVNEKCSPVPCGVVGELAIGGPGVSLGYINDTSRTATKFVDLTLSGCPDRRFYLTGDQAYFDGDGEIHFLGRRDRQVKVSGYRLELDELEAVIGQAPGVRGCHCDLAGGLGDELIAFVALDQSVSSREAITSHARSQLPVYKVPSRFVFVDRLPLTKNGKVDVAALEQLSEQGRQAASQEAAAEFDFTALIRDVWRQELDTDAFGDDDNFFDVGGSSLKIMLVHDELSKRLREQGQAVEIDITHLFEFATVASLAEFLEELANGS